MEHGPIFIQAPVKRRSLPPGLLNRKLDLERNNNELDAHISHRDPFGDEKSMYQSIGGITQSEQVSFGFHITPIVSALSTTSIMIFCCTLWLLRAEEGENLSESTKGVEAYLCLHMRLQLWFCIV